MLLQPPDHRQSISLGVSPLVGATSSALQSFEQLVVNVWDFGKLSVRKSMCICESVRASCVCRFCVCNVCNECVQHALVDAHKIEYYLLFYFYMLISFSAFIAGQDVYYSTHHVRVLISRSHSFHFAAHFLFFISTFSFSSSNVLFVSAIN